MPKGEKAGLAPGHEDELELAHVHQAALRLVQAVDFHAHQDGDEGDAQEGIITVDGFRLVDVDGENRSDQSPQIIAGKEAHHDGDRVGHDLEGGEDLFVMGERDQAVKSGLRQYAGPVSTDGIGFHGIEYPGSGRFYDRSAALSGLQDVLFICASTKIGCTGYHTLKIQRQKISLFFHCMTFVRFLLPKRWPVYDIFTPLCLLYFRELRFQPYLSNRKCHSVFRHDIGIPAHRTRPSI